MLREDEDPILVLDGKQFFKRVALEELAPTKERLLDLLDSTIQQQEELLLRQGAGEHEGLPQERFLRRMIDLRDKVRQEVLKI
jgi:hypothetical protein